MNDQRSESARLKSFQEWLSRNNLPQDAPMELRHVYVRDSGEVFISSFELPERPQRKVTVIDSIMGSGKTTFILNKIKATHQAELFTDGPKAKFLVVVPLLEEVKRFKEVCREVDFKEPQAIHGKKLLHLDKLIEEGENVVTTHSLFKLLNRDIYQRLQEQNYVLIIDEVLDCVDLFTDIKAKDIKLLFDSGMVWVEDDTKKLRWNYEKHGDYQGRFEDIRKLCDIGSLVWFNDSVLVWEFPSEFLTCFKKVYVLTYLFGGSPFYAYLKAEGFTIDTKSIHRGELFDWKTDGLILDIMKKEKLRPLLNVYEGPLNDIGNTPKGKGNPLSSGWFDRVARSDPKSLERLRANLYNFFTNVAKTPSAFNGWTAFGSVRKHLAGKPYTKGWIANNIKATNDFAEKRSMAYCCNWFYHPQVRNYFLSRGVEVNEDMYALSSMIQWIWRAAIRKATPEPIDLYIPSERMRNLFKDWLAGEAYLYVHPEEHLAAEDLEEALLV